MLKNWEWVVVAKYEDDYIERFEFKNVQEAYEKFDECRISAESVLLIVYPSDKMYHPSIMMAYNNSWADDFIPWPDWLG